MELKIIKTEEAFIGLKGGWTDIVERMEDATPFQTWQWNYYYWKSHPDELLIMTAVIDKQIYGVAPLVVRDKQIEFIGEKNFDYGMFICAERKAAVADLFFSELKSLFKSERLVLNLRNIPIWCSQYVLFRERAKLDRRALCSEIVSTAGINLGEYGSFQRYCMAISTSLRKKAIKPCLIANTVYSVEPYSDALWSEIERIYQRRMEDRIGISTLDWAKDVVRYLNAEGLLKIGMLKLDGEYCAFGIFFDFAGTYSSWLTAFASVNNYSLGHYIRYCLIQTAFENRIEYVDLMRGAYDYKKEWDAGISCNVELRSFRNVFKKSLYAFKLRVRPIAKRIVYQNRLLKAIYRKLSKMGG